MRIASFVLAAALAACSDGGGQSVAAQIAQYGPILQDCVELRSLDLLRLLDEFAAILGGPAGPFQREIDLDGDGDGDVTVTGGILDTGPGMRGIEWDLAGTVTGSGVFSVTTAEDGSFAVSGSGVLSDSECDFDFEIEEATLLPPALAGASSTPCAGQQVAMYAAPVAAVHRPSESSMTGNANRGPSVGAPPPSCVSNPQITVSGGSGAWPAFCFGGCAGATVPATVPLCAVDALDLLREIIEEAAALTATAVASGTLPPGVSPVAGPPDTDFTFEVTVASRNVTVRGALFFPRDPTQPGSIGVGDRIVASFAVSGDVSGSLIGVNLDILGVTQLTIDCESGFLAMAGCEIEFSFFGMQLGPAPDLRGTMDVDRIQVFSPPAEVSATIEFPVGPGAIMRDVFVGSVPVPGTFAIQSNY